MKLDLRKSLSHKRVTVTKVSHSSCLTKKTAYRHLKILGIGIVLTTLLITNIFLTSKPTSNHQTGVSLVMVEARADATGENDIPDPDPDPITFSFFPKNWSFSAFIDYLFE